MGVDVEELPDGLIIRGGAKPRLEAGAKYLTPRCTGASLDGRSDHRIVMALAIAGLASDEPCAVETAEAMRVTFPDYVKLMKSMGANMELTD
jgi:3-phosphoshikimate 1-carboxyvinyltransferase